MTDEDFELMFLGHVLDRRDHAADARAIIDADVHFGNPAIASAWHSLWALADEFRVFSPADWCQRLYMAGVDDATAIVHKARVLGEEPAAPLVREAREVVRRSDVRAQVEILADGIKRLRGGRDDAEHVREDTIGKLVTQRSETRKHYYDGPEMAKRLEEELAARARNTGRILGFSSGIDELDVMSGGMQQGRLIVLGSRPGVGKTSFALQCAGQVMEAGGHAMILSFEMDAEDLALRMLAQTAQIPTHVCERGQLTPEQNQDAARLYGLLMRTKSSWVDSPNLTIDQIVGRASAIHAVRPLNLIVVDYIQLVASKSKFRGGNRNLEVAEISRALKELSRQLKCTVLALSQLSRRSEGGDSEGEGMKEPQLSDLRDSGAIEQDADQVWLLHRRQRDSQDASINFAKNRRGPCGRVRLSFNGQCTSFGNYAAPLRSISSSPTDAFNNLVSNAQKS